MKKVYIIPTITFVSYQVEAIMQEVSGVFGPDQGIGYGGVDEEGTKDPAAKSFSVWDEE
ncbi:MAG: hypothetical protein IJL54_07335 [Prevotella sp.]|nr:hypothetical protein [Prevotella sp.]